MEQEEPREDSFAAPLSKRASVLSRLKSTHKDLPDDDESVFGAIENDYTASEALRGEAQKLTEFLDDNPKAANFFMAWKKGENIIAYLMREFGDEFKAALDDPDKIEGFAEAHNQYIARVAKDKELSVNAEANITKSFEALEQVKNEHNLSDDQVQSVWNTAYGIVLKGISSEFDKDTYVMIIKSLNYDTDIADAAHVAEVRGKNSKISELRKKNEEQLPTTLSGSAAPIHEERKSRNPWLASRE